MLDANTQCVSENHAAARNFHLSPKLSTQGELENWVFKVCAPTKFCKFCSPGGYYHSDPGVNVRQVSGSQYVPYYKMYSYTTTRLKPLVGNKLPT